MSQHAVLAAQRRVIRDSFNGKRSAYLAALRQAHATAGIALSVLGDEIRRARLEQPRDARRPTAGEVAAFYSAYPDLLAIPNTEKVDVVQVFRRSEDVPPVVEQAIKIGAKVVWMQVDVINPEALERKQR